MVLMSPQTFSYLCWADILVSFAGDIALRKKFVGADGTVGDLPGYARMYTIKGLCELGAGLLLLIFFFIEDFGGLPLYPVRALLDLHAHPPPAPLDQPRRRRPPLPPANALVTRRRGTTHFRVTAFQTTAN